MRKPRTIAEELVLSTLSDDDKSASSAVLVLRCPSCAPVLPPVPLDGIQCWHHGMSDELFSDATVVAIVHLKEP